MHPLFCFLTGKLHYRQWNFWHLTTCRYTGIKNRLSPNMCVQSSVFHRKCYGRLRRPFLMAFRRPHTDYQGRQKYSACVQQLAHRKLSILKQKPHFFNVWGPSTKKTGGYLGPTTVRCKVSRWARTISRCGSQEFGGGGSFTESFALLKKNISL